MFSTGTLYQKCKIFTILRLFHMKYTTTDPWFFWVWQHIKKTLQFSFGCNLGQKSLWKVIVQYSIIFFKLWQQIFFCLGTPDSIGWFWKDSWSFLRKLTLIGDNHGKTRKLISKIKENRFYYNFEQCFLVWETKWYSEIGISWKISTSSSQ